MVICLCTNQKLPTCSTAAFHRYHVWLGQQFPAPTGFVKSITEQAAPSYSKKFPSGQCCVSLPPANQRSAGAEATAWRRTAHRQLLAAVVAMVSAKVLRVLWTQLFPFRKWGCQLYPRSWGTAYAPSVVDIASADKGQHRGNWNEKLEDSFV